MSLFTKMFIAPKTALNSTLNGGHSPGLASIVLPLRIADSRADEIAMISHELRNSLGVVRNAARLLRFPVGENGIDGARVLIERHVGQMSRHIEELLDASHARAQEGIAAVARWICEPSWNSRSMRSRRIWRAMGIAWWLVCLPMRFGCMPTSRASSRCSRTC